MILYISPYNDAYRYLTFMVPIWVMMLITATYALLSGCRWTKKYPGIFLAAAIFLLSTYSYMAGSVDYLYQERADNLDNRMEAYSSLPAVCVSEIRTNMTIAVPLLIRHENSCYVEPENAGHQISQMLKLNGQTGKPIVVYLPNWTDSERGMPDFYYIKEIAQECGYSHYQIILNRESSGLLTSGYILE